MHTEERKDSDFENSFETEVRSVKFSVRNKHTHKADGKATRRANSRMYYHH